MLNEVLYSQQLQICMSGCMNECWTNLTTTFHTDICSYSVVKTACRCLCSPSTTFPALSRHVFNGTQSELRKAFYDSSCAHKKR